MDTNIGLDWVLGEVNNTLNTAKEQINQYVEGTEGSGKLLVEFQESLQSIKGSLEILEISGAAMLLKEMGDLSQHLEQLNAEQSASAIDTLVEALLAIPLILERVKRDGKEPILKILSHINNIRAVRAVDLLIIPSLFSPDLSVALKETDPRIQKRLQDPKVKANISKLHQIFKHALEQVLEQDDFNEHLQYLKKVAIKLIKFLKGSSLGVTWEVIHEYFDALDLPDSDLSLSVRHTLNRIDILLGSLITSDNLKVESDLIKSLLFQVASSPRQTDSGTEMLERFGIEYFPIDNSNEAEDASLDRETQLSLVTAIQDELGIIKVALDQYSVEQWTGDKWSESVSTPCQNLANTFSLLGFSVPHKVLLDLGKQQTDIDEQLLATVAEELVYIDTYLESVKARREIIGDGEQEEYIAAEQRLLAVNNIFVESKKEIEAIKLMLTALIGNLGDSEKQSAVNDQVSKIHAVLKFSGDEQALEVISACTDFISAKGIANLNETQLRNVGDTLVCLEFLLEQLAQGVEDNTIVMRHARDSIKLLEVKGGAEDNEAEVSEENELIDADILEVFAEELNEVTGEIKELITEVGESGCNPDQLANLRRHFHTLKGSGNLVGAKEVAEVAKSYEDLYSDLITLKIAVDTRHIDLAESFLALSDKLVENFGNNQPTPEISDLVEKINTERKSLASPVEEEEEIELVDQEILDIFIEESNEVLEVISEHLKKITIPNPDVSQVTELRRAFHTLKGSGRLVSAVTLSDVAWAAENLLNRVLDSSVAFGPEVMDAVIDARTALPSLVEAFSNNVETDKPVELIDRCEKLSRGEVVSTDDHGVPQEEKAGTSDAGSEAIDEVITVEEMTEQETSLVEIFKSETQGHIETLFDYIKESRESDSPKISESVGRAFHTLKGSAKTANIQSIAKIVIPFEGLVKEYRGRDIAVESEFIELLEDLVHFVQQEINEESGSNEADQVDSNSLLERIEHLTERVEQMPAHAQNEGIKRDNQLINTFLNESMDLMFSAEQLMDGKTHETIGREDLETLWSTLSKVRNGARVIELNALSELANELALAYERLAENDGSLRSDDYHILVEAHEQVIDYLNQTAAGLDNESNIKLLKRIVSLRTHWDKRKPASTPDIETEDTAATASTEQDGEQSIQDLFMEEVANLHTELQTKRSRLIDKEAFNEDEYRASQMLLHTLKGSARLAERTAIANACAALENLFDSALTIQQVVEESLLDFILNEIEEMQALDNWKEDQILLRVADYMAGQQSSENAGNEPSELDSELIEIYLEEARDIIDQSADLLRTWEESADDLDTVGHLQRQLHTLKGGARMAQVREIGDLAHEMETIFERIVQGQLTVSNAVISAAVKSHDGLAAMVDQLSANEAISDPSNLITLCRAALSGDLESVSTAPVEEVLEESESAEEIVEVETEPDASVEIQEEQVEEPEPQVEDKAAQDDIKVEDSKPILAPQKKAEPKRASPQETIRVSAPLLDSLVNLAGETSISRGRIEQEISDFAFTLEEMSSTIERLREQLRRMDMETEAQILFRAEKDGFAGPAHDDFDPLEMDRYSTIQQLSRGLSESASDLLELREALADKTRDAETVLLQQSRINSELQEGLMKTRMIPFSSMVPRLRRIVRQVSDELDKQVEFEVLNADGEMDRTILERMIAPLEHMLRNAVDHGIENRSTRLKRNKSGTGTISLSFAREGGDIVLSLKDDGGGIDLAKVEQKAVKQKLLPKNSKAQPHDILQLIMQPGFSTASKVTQISGRGVGMDVVASEIKQIGGSIDIDSTLNEGTTFEIRLPFTVSVNRALMVKIGEDFYAIPLNTIEGIVRVSAYELDAYYSGEASSYEYAGQKYRMQYLGHLLNSEHQPKLQGQPLPLPVILVRGTDKPIALQVDSLMGSREIVVKSLGPQFAQVHGVSGATILGDGHVVVILDLPALIRDHDSIKPVVKSETTSTAISSFQSKLVMVIDDSVTVRKVTSRLLERNGYEVITAKDGVDAIAMLQDHMPDILLLDIEMPRMDGFEVATLVRHDDRLKHVPIVMITSRTGQKHRDRAFAIGVNEYIGKPFQEQDLLETIDKLTLTSSETT